MEVYDIIIDGRPGKGVAQPWPSGDLPLALAGLLGDLVWCDEQAEYVPMEPERLTEIPSVGD